MRIALFDYKVMHSNPIGGCHLRMLRALAREHDFTVFAVQFDNPYPEKIRWIRVPAPLRPLPLLFLVYHLLAPILYLICLLRDKRRFDLLQLVETNFSFGDIAYSHFCHTSYLKNHWKKTGTRGWRGLSRLLDHRFHACPERRIYSKVKQLVVPSKGLAAELAIEFPQASSKIRVLPNAIDVDALQAPSSFNRNAVRDEIGFSDTDVVFVFIALGHFERKGLPLLMEALSQARLKNARLLVVGGTKDLIGHYQVVAQNTGLEDSIRFVGMQSNISKYLWASDVFALASTYETFSLVAFEAAAASLPLVTPMLYGIEEIVRDGITGYVVGRTAEDFAVAMRQLVQMAPEARREMGKCARLAAMQYNEAHFVNNWREVYSDWAVERLLGKPSPAEPHSPTLA